MWLRKLHRGFGLVASPFIFLTAVCGGLLLLDDLHVFGEEFEGKIYGLHNWTIVGEYAGLVLVGLIIVTNCSGALLWLQTTLRKHAAKAAQSKQK